MGCCRRKLGWSAERWRRRIQRSLSGGERVLRKALARSCVFFGDLMGSPRQPAPPPSRRYAPRHLPRASRKGGEHPAMRRFVCKVESRVRTLLPCAAGEVAAKPTEGALAGGLFLRGVEVLLDRGEFGV